MTIHRTVGAAAISALLLTACSGQQATEPPVEEPTTTPTSEAPSPTPTPTKAPLEVAGHRYVDACNLLTRADVEELFGPLEGRGLMEQDRLTVSTTDPDGRSVCTYNDYRDDPDLRRTRTQVIVRVEHHASAERAVESVARWFAVGSGENRAFLEDQLARLPEDVANGTYTPEMAEGVRQTIEGALAMGRETAALEGVVALPSLPADIVFRSGRGMFQKAIDNLVVTINYEEHGVMGMGSGVTQVDPADPAANEIGAKVAQAFTIIDANARNDDLSQDFIPTQGIEHIGETEVVDACAILTEELVEESTGQAPWREESKGLWADIEKGLTQVDAMREQPSTECRRSWGASGGRKGDIRLVVMMTPDSAEANALFDRLSDGWQQMAVDGAVGAAVSPRFPIMRATKGGYVTRLDINGSQEPGWMVSLTERVLEALPSN